ncbi:hypothetical protein QYF36_016778 [Acer negundo]|nr:hypothetical protein QYF36_016778 [Acer negundo]
MDFNSLLTSPHPHLGLNRSPVNCGARSLWSRASICRRPVDLQLVSTLQSPFSILHSPFSILFSFQLTQGARRSLLKKAWPSIILT